MKPSSISISLEPHLLKKDLKQKSKIFTYFLKFNLFPFLKCDTRCTKIYFQKYFDKILSKQHSPSLKCVSLILTIKHKFKFKNIRKFIFLEIRDPSTSTWRTSPSWQRSWSTQCRARCKRDNWRWCAWCQRWKAACYSNSWTSAARSWSSDP